MRALRFNFIRIEVQAMLIVFLLSSIARSDEATSNELIESLGALGFKTVELSECILVAKMRIAGATEGAVDEYNFKVDLGVLDFSNIIFNKLTGSTPNQYVGKIWFSGSYEADRIVIDEISEHVSRLYKRDWPQHPPFRFDEQNSTIEAAIEEKVDRLRSLSIFRSGTVYTTVPFVDGFYLTDSNPSTISHVFRSMRAAAESRKCG